MTYVTQNKNTARLPNQQGSVLIISLLILLVLTIIGATALNSTVMEEKMSSNFQQGNIAFQAAESGINRTYINIAQTSDSSNPNDLVEQARLAANVNPPVWPTDNHNMQGITNTSENNPNVVSNSQINTIVRFVGEDPSAEQAAGVSMNINNQNTPGADIVEIVSTGRLAGTNVARTQTQGVSKLKPGKTSAD